MNATFSSPLNNLKIASPCSQDWDAMIGSDRKRFCGECQLNVYNLSGMTRAEAENLIMNAEGRLCVRFYKRADGTVLTEDCPVGWQALKKRISRTATAFVSLLFGLIGGLGFIALFEREKKAPVIMGAMVKNIDDNSNAATMGEIENEPKPMMGNIEVMGGIRPIPRTGQKPDRSKRINREIVGKIVNE